MKANFRFRSPSKLAAVCVLAVSGLAAAATLYSALCAFSWQRNALSDYGIYLNMMWNTAHGAPFRYLIDSSYLRVHLSFTVGLMGLAFRLVDHPTLLVWLQWLCSVVGCAVVFATARRLRIPLLPAAALVFFYIGYRFVQSVHLHQFHGVALYLALIPILYAALRVRPSWAWAPLGLILGVREDAFLIVLPMLTHFACRASRRWMWGLVAGSIAYGLAALFVIYPALNNLSVFAKREAEMPSLAIFSALGDSALQPRLRALALVLLPLLSVGRGRWLPVLVYPSAAVLLSLASSWPSQYGLGSHYAASVAALMVCGLLESFAGRAVEATPQPQGRRSWAWASAWLVVVTALVHLESGFLPGGAKNLPEFNSYHLRADSIMAAARHIPREGVLMTSDNLIPFVANRRDVLAWHLNRRDIPYDHVLTSVGDLAKWEKGRLVEALRSGEFGARFFDGQYVVISRGYRTALNDEVLRSSQQRLVANSAGHGGKNRLFLHCPVRYWDGDGSRAPINLSHGRYWDFDPGVYRLTLEYRADEPRRAVKRHWGWMSLHELGKAEALVEAEIPEVPAPAYGWQQLTLTITTEVRRPIEFRITGGDAPLHLYRVYWRAIP